MKELIGKICKIYVKNLSGKFVGDNNNAVAEKPIIYSAEIIGFEEIGKTSFIKIIDRTGQTVRINVDDIIQLTEISDEGNY